MRREGDNGIVILVICFFRSEKKKLIWDKFYFVVIFGIFIGDKIKDEM